MRSDEFTRKLTRADNHAAQPSCEAARPISETRSTGPTAKSIPVFDVQSPVGSRLARSRDPRERLLRQARRLEPGDRRGQDGRRRDHRVVRSRHGRSRLGCAAGAVLECLRSRGVEAEGIEISSSALRPRRNPCEAASIREISSPSTCPTVHDMVFGLDVFEHLNPNRLDQYIARIAAITSDARMALLQHPSVWRGPGLRNGLPALR